MVIASGFFNCKEVEDQVQQQSPALMKPFEPFVGRIPVTFPRNLVDAEELPLPENESVQTLVSVSNIVVPDSSRIMWEQIIELRNDKSAIDRLRRLRVFAATAYEGKSQSFIEDDFLVRLRDYEETLKSWDLKTAIGVLSTTLKSQSTISSGILALTLATYGFSTATAITQAVALPLGHAAIEVAKLIVAKNSKQDCHPLGYVTSVQKLVTPG